MKNIANIKKEQNLNFIIPVDYCILDTKSFHSSCLFVIHLYYKEDVDLYIDYILQIPQEMHKCFTYVFDETKSILEKELIAHNYKNYIFIKKQNRGRDISALLVAAVPEILKYKFVCFLHDKRTTSEQLLKDTEYWRYALWSNLLYSPLYIENILALFVKNPELGIVVPPSFFSNHMSVAFLNGWSTVFEISKELAKKLNLVSDIDKHIDPITYGTCFFARVDALKKLFYVNWKYEDFAPEPLPITGTLSHGIERILGYVAQDAGYTCGWCMTPSFASTYIEDALHALHSSFSVLKEEFGIEYISELATYKKERERLNNFSKGKSRIYIYGAGNYGKNCAKVLLDINIHPYAFLVSEIDSVKNYNELNDYTTNKQSVLELSKVSISNSDGIIIAVNPTLVKEIQHNLSFISNKKQIYVYNRLR